MTDETEVPQEPAPDTFIVNSDDMCFVGDPPPIFGETGSEHEVASAVARAVDSLSDLSKFLPLPDEATARFRRSIFEAWRQLLNDASLCSDDGVLEDNEDG